MLSAAHHAKPHRTVPSCAQVRITVADMTDMAGARFMESFESRHSDHTFTAAVVRCWQLVQELGWLARWLHFVTVNCAQAAEATQLMYPVAAIHGSCGG